MKLRNAGCAIGASVLLITLFPAAGQEAPSLPKVLRIVREEVKQGKGAAHEKVEASWAKASAKYKYPAYDLGCEVLAGPSEVWFFEGHPSMMSFQNATDLIAKTPAMKAEFSNIESMDGELRSASTSMLAVLRDDLSYRTSQFAQDLGKTRYFTMTIMRVRPFADGRFGELGKQVIAAYERANIELPTATYQVVSGGPGGMYLLFYPMKSLETMDETSRRSQAMVSIMGPERAAALYKNASEVVAGTQSLLLAINPRISYVSKELAAQDPEFWTPKPAISSTKPAVPKTAEKPPAGQ